MQYLIFAQIPDLFTVCDNDINFILLEIHNTPEIAMLLKSVSTKFSTSVLFGPIQADMRL